MKIRPLRLFGTYEVLMNPHQDDRGYFMRVYDEEIFQEFDLQTKWVQENESRSIEKHIIRGLHFQAPPHAETKLIRVIHGSILDVFVDLRKDSKTFGQWDSIELSAENCKLAYIPKGFAHGYCTLTDVALVQYKVDAFYAPQSEGGIRWNDETLNISWPVRTPFLSDKDKALLSFETLRSPF